MIVYSSINYLIHRRLLWQDKLEAIVQLANLKKNLPPGTIRNRDGRDTRSDKKIGTIRKEAEKKNK